MSQKIPIIIISGPTASGKTKLSLRLSEYYNSIIINADSVQVFSDLPILTAQPTNIEKKNIPHYLLGYKDAKAEINSKIWLHDCLNILQKPIHSKKIPFLVGGTGLYLKALLEGIIEIDEIDSKIKDYCKTLFHELGKENFYQNLITIDPLIQGKIHNNDSQRMIRALEVKLGTKRSIIEWHQSKKQAFFDINNFLYIFITPKKEVLHQNCNSRFLEMIEHGVIQEISALYDIIGDEQYNITKAHGYKEILKYIKGEWSLNEAIERSQILTRQYTKRQITWFKHQVKNGHYLEYENFDQILFQVNQLIKEFLQNF